MSMYNKSPLESVAGREVEMVCVMDEDWVAGQCRHVCLLSLFVEGDADAVAEIF